MEHDYIEHPLPAEILWQILDFLGTDNQMVIPLFRLVSRFYREVIDEYSDINEIYTVPIDRLIDWHAYDGNISVLKYLHEIGCFWTKTCCSSAALGNQLECLKYLHEKKAPWTSQICDSAVRSGSFECLNYASENGCALTTLAFSTATRVGNIDMLRYLHKNGCPHDPECLRIAVEENNLECVKFFVEKGFRQDPLWSHARRHNRQEILAYLNALHELQATIQL